MAKTKSTENPQPEEKSDGLEIISIGSLYKGPWDKKYWSSSRGKDRYPYPVGYQATRAHNGTTYKMEIYEGASGPRFVISSADGYSCSGKTPDIAWEEFQKRGCPRMKIWHGKRLSSKMDGLELFGFKNPFVQRLLRELMADLNGIAEQSLNCDKISRTEHDHRSQNVGTYPDLLLCLGRPQITGKRSRRCENKSVKLHGGSFLKKSRPWELTCSSRASGIKTKESHSLASSISHNGLEEENGAHNLTSASASMHIMSSAGESANCFSFENGFPLNRNDISDDQKGRAVYERTSAFVDSSNCQATVIADSFSTEEEPLHRSQDAELKMSSILVAREDKKPLASVSKDSEGCIDSDLCAPDTMDFLLENNSDSTPSILDKNAYDERAYQMISGDVLSTEHREEVLTSNSNPSFEKIVFDSGGGQDVAKSMMTVLLPQAIPLLKKDSSNKKLTISTSGILPSFVNSIEKDKNFLEVPSSVVTEDAYMEREEKMHMPNADLSSVIPSSEHAKFVIVNSLEYNHCEDHKIDQAIFYSDIAEADRAGLNKETCSPRSRERHDGGALPNKSSMCHADVNPRKNKFCNVSELDFEELPQDGDVCVPDSVLDHMSPTSRVISETSNDACTDLEENSVQVGFNSMQKDLKAAHDFTGDINNALEKKTQDEVVDKTGDAETSTMITPSSQLPNLVYTRRKMRNADTLSENCPLSENSTCDKYGEHVTSDLHIAKGTLPPSETIQMNTSDKKLCEPDLLGNQAKDDVQSDDLQRDNYVTSSHIKQSTIMSENEPSLCATKESIFLCPDRSVSHVDIPQIHGDVQCGYNDLAELNNSISCWNPNLRSCENNCFPEEAQVVLEPNPCRNKDLNNLDGIKFVGCYLHPLPVSSLLLSRRGNEIYICVFCGPVVDQERTLFTYKIAVKEPKVGCPSFIAYTSIMLPDPKHNFVRETVVERSGVQLTPDGHIVLLGTIKTPNCRERNFCCCCSTCTSVCSEENALKIVQVEHGYASVVATLKTAEVVHCILVCEPNQLVSVGESGRLRVWVMNSTWREKIEDFIIPADDSISPGIEELKRVPKCAHLVVGNNSVGEFSLWDISKRICVSSFSASTNPISQFFPVSLFHWQTNSSVFSYTSMEEQADQLLRATSLWFSEHKEICSLLPSEERDIAMWLLVSTATDLQTQHNCISSNCQINTARSWRLALLVKNDMILGSPLDPRATAIGVLGGHGIISTCDGLVYIWELSRGSKLGTLHHFQDGTVTCIATDDWTGGALGVAGEGKVLVYLHHNELDAQ